MQARTTWIAGGILVAISVSAPVQADDTYDVDVYLEGVLGLAMLDDGRYRVLLPDLTDPSKLPSSVGTNVQTHQPRIWFAEENLVSSTTAVGEEMRCVHPENDMSYIQIANRDIAPCDPLSIGCTGVVKAHDEVVCPPRVCLDGDADAACTKCASVPFVEEYQSLKWLPNIGRLARHVDLSKPWNVNPDLLLDDCLCEAVTARLTFQEGDLSVGNFFTPYPHTVHEFKHAPKYPNQIMPHSFRLRLKLSVAEDLTIYGSILGRGQWSPLLRLRPVNGRDFTVFISNSIVVDESGDCLSPNHDFIGHYLVLENLPDPLPFPKFPGPDDNAQCAPAEYRP